MPYPLFLDSATAPSRLARYSFIMADPALLVRSRGRHVQVMDLRRQATSEIQGNALTVARTLLEPHRAEPVVGLPPFQAGMAGYVGYDFGAVLERLPSPRFDDLGISDIVLALYDWVIAWDHELERTWIISTGAPEMGDAKAARAAKRMEWLKSSLLHGDPPGADRPRRSYVAAKETIQAPSYEIAGLDSPGPATIRSSFTRDTYLAAIERTQEYIRAGDIFQANLSQRFETPLREHPWTVYRRLRALNPAPFASYFDFHDGVVLSASPERFLHVQDGRVETRPIKGTRPRGTTAEQDRSFSNELLLSEKDRAEHVMIVDVLRNDISRVCEFGTVKVPELFSLEHYSTVHHLVSTVVGHLRPDADAFDLLGAAFPGGSITGAPKIRAMEIIAELEPSRRGIYCGAVGYIGTTGAMDTSIIIRTYLATNGTLYFSAGGGIVADSIPEQEYQETFDKAQALIAAVTTPHTVERG